MAKRIRAPKIQLNKDQQRAVEWLDGPLLISAGPGSGKTRVITERTAYMLKQGIPSESILATTFTKKAAEEMNKRLEAKGVDTKRMSIQTTHSYCWSLMRRHSRFRNWEVDDKNIAHIVLKEILGYKDMNWRTDITKVESFIAECRNTLTEPTSNEAKKLAWNPGFGSGRYIEAYMRYDEEMAARRLVTFDDMLFHGTMLLLKDERTRDREQGRYMYVMVDECQDNNLAQIVMAETVAHPENNLVICGDDDQSLYGWRGAEPSYVVSGFKEKFDAEVVTLGINYRCAPNIVEHAARCIEHNQARITKDLSANKTEPGSITFESCGDTDEEATFVGQQVQTLMEDGISPGKMFVLMRTNAQSRAIEEEFIRLKIPFVVLGSVSFYDRKEIKDLLSYLRVLDDPRDVASGDRALCRPFRYIKKKVLDDIRHKAGKNPDGYLDTLGKMFDRGGLDVFAGAFNAVGDFLDMMCSFQEDDPPSKVLKTIVDTTNYIEYLRQEEGSDSPETSRAGNVGELIASATRFQTVREFLEHIELQIKLRRRSQKKKDENRVTVMTIHRGKGTEATAVFLIGANEGTMPHGMGDEEEERRLFYVACTRAEEYLYVTAPRGVSTGTGVHSCPPSRFVYEAGIVKEEEPELPGVEVKPEDMLDELLAAEKAGTLHPAGRDMLDAMRPRGDAATLHADELMNQDEDEKDDLDLLE